MDREKLLQKMWNALHEAEDRYERQYTGTDLHDNWFLIYRPWLQQGFEIALHTLDEETTQILR